MRIGIAGVTGRMGRLVVEALRGTPAILAGGIARTAAPGHERPLLADIAALAAVSDVVIDFTTADTAIAHAAALADAGTGWVLGTTGLDAPARAAVRQAAARIAVVQAANFAPGIALLLELAQRLGQALPADRFDAEITDLHHRQKRDAPSGTALALGHAVARGRGVAFDAVARTDRAGPRAEGDIGFAAIRAGQIVGEHVLSFTGGAEQITLTHRAFDRAVFADGAVRAALWLHHCPPGLYGMADVMNPDGSADPPARP